MYVTNSASGVAQKSWKWVMGCAVLMVLLAMIPPANADPLNFNVRRTWQVEKHIPFQVCVRWSGQHPYHAPAGVHPNVDILRQPAHGISDLEAEAAFRKKNDDDAGWDGASHDYFYDNKEGVWYAWDQGERYGENTLPSHCVEWETRYNTVRFGTADVYAPNDNVQKPVVVVAPYNLPLNRHDPVAWAAKDLFDELESDYGYYALTALREAGYDPIIYRYKSPNEGIAYNAEGLEILLNRLRDTSSVSDIGVIGLSMGGVVARYALTRMDHLNRSHKVRAFISYDAPHGGINIPVSLDENLRRLSEKLNKTVIKDLCDNEPGCYEGRRNLNHFKALLGTKTLSELVLLPRSGKPERHALLNSLSQMGAYPNDIPSYALANGSPGTNQGYADMKLIMKFRLNSYINYNFSVWYNNPDYLDNAPGGYADMYGEFARQIHEAATGNSKLDWIYGDPDNMRRHAFVPTVSAIPSDNPWGWAGIRYGNGNEPHMHVTDGHKDKLIEWLDARM